MLSAVLVKLKLLLYLEDFSCDSLSYIRSGLCGR